MPADSGPSLDPNLARIVDAWPTLLEPVKAAMLALARVGSPEAERK